MDLIICAGQSNMAGRPDVNDGSFDLDVLSSVMFRYHNNFNFGPGDVSDVWVPLCAQYAPDHDYSHFGPELTLAPFLKEVAEKEGRQVAIVKVGLGSTNLSVNWNPNSSSAKAYYGRFKAFVDDAISNLKETHSDLRVRAFFWLQGESDTSSSKTANKYKNNLENFIRTVREDFESPDMLFIAGKIRWPTGKYEDTVNAAIEEVLTSDPKGDWISNDQYQLAEDNHLTAQDMQLCGQLFGEKYINLIQQH
eukprot:TRINITY_DN8349_c0_g1_i1.p1 TRINITY_DN8349_c0_g1~~TRINITY_DN8349_c0_g1_i1.p1  ORF type:complete len:250 (+),score=49.33 TRINITY_DN8349_c0_g1_i1:97-846(+)